jgi:hypothetical protein
VRSAASRRYAPVRSLSPVFDGPSRQYEEAMSEGRAGGSGSVDAPRVRVHGLARGVEVERAWAKGSCRARSLQVGRASRPLHALRFESGSRRASPAGERPCEFAVWRQGGLAGWAGGRNARGVWKQRACRPHGAPDRALEGASRVWEHWGAEVVARLVQAGVMGRRTRG